MKTSRKKSRANSRRGTANSRFLRARNRAIRPSGPYRPSHKPRPSRYAGLSNFWIIVFLIGLAFSLGQIWKAHEVALLCTRLDGLRSQQRNLEEQFLSLQLKFEEITAYHRIEPLAREKLGMETSPHPPVIIAPVDNRFMAFRRKTAAKYLRGQD